MFKAKFKKGWRMLLLHLWIRYYKWSCNPYFLLFSCYKWSCNSFLFSFLSIHRRQFMKFTTLYLWLISEHNAAKDHPWRHDCVSNLGNVEFSQTSGFLCQFSIRQGILFELIVAEKCTVGSCSLTVTCMYNQLSTVARLRAFLVLDISNLASVVYRILFKIFVPLKQQT